ncbi:hypothetical protein [Geobacter sp.]|uniref:hypothetical protein n=1 Tax=Geobacter sp. TaxID=46610 RepID=UPI002610163A|nr:hypothetical protein [Geobacter sp.]
MTQISRNYARRLARTMALLSALASLISTTGCSRRYVVVDANKPAAISQGEVDRLYQDNELLLKALEECRSAR